MSNHSVEKSAVVVGNNGVIKREASSSADVQFKGSKKNQLTQAVEYITELQIELCNQVDHKEDILEEIAKIKAKLKTSPLLAKLRALTKEAKQTSANISEISSRRAGAMGLCEQQGIDVKKHLKVAIAIEEGDE